MAASVEAHRSRILASVAPLPAESVALADAAGRVSAEDVVAVLPVPRFDNAAMDGYAVRAADVATVPATLRVAGVVAAGDAWPGDLPDGAALRTMTGAPMPGGADTVVPFEATDRGAEQVRVERSALAGQHVRRAAEDVAAGSVVVTAGTPLRPTHLGLLAATGARAVVVRPRPRVAVIATGAELGGASYLRNSLGSAGQPNEFLRYDDLPAGQVPDSNSVTIAAAVRAVGGTPIVRGPVPDDPGAFLDLVADAADAADLVITTGGVSAGDHDVVKAALADRDGMWFGSVAVKPGRPQGAGALRAGDGRDVPVVCLPGTPVAAYTTFLLFAAPAIRLLQALPQPSAEPSETPRTSAPHEPLVQTRELAAPLTPSPDRTVVLPGRRDEAGRVVVLQGHVGHSQRLLAEADVLLVVPPGEPMAAGETVDVLAI